MADWQTGNPRQLIAALRPGGATYAQSGLFPRFISIGKTDMIADLRKLPADHVCNWRIQGNPSEAGRYARDRRTVVIWVGK